MNDINSVGNRQGFVFCCRARGPDEFIFKLHVNNYCILKYVFLHTYSTSTSGNT